MVDRDKMERTDFAELWFFLLSKWGSLFWNLLREFSNSFPRQERLLSSCARFTKCWIISSRGIFQAFSRPPLNERKAKPPKILLHQSWKITGTKKNSWGVSRQQYVIVVRSGHLEWPRLLLDRHCLSWAVLRTGPSMLWVGYSSRKR